MLLRAPWLSHRLALIGLVLWDATSIYTCYNAIYLARIGRWEGINSGLTVILTTWLGASYLLGRYSPSKETSGRHRVTQTAKTIVTAIAVIAVFVGHSWAYQVVEAQTRFRGFLIPLLVSTCLMSEVGQTVNAGILNLRRRWLLIGNDLEKLTIHGELKSEKDELTARTSTLDEPDQVIKLEDDITGQQVGIAIGSIENYGVELTEGLFRLREKGRLVVPLLSWCEQELHRIPPELVHSEWLIQAEGFGLRPGSMSWRIKRIGDIMGAVALLSITLPLIVSGCLFVWLEDGGPVLYRQVRSGLYGKPIEIWKIRSMRRDAERTGAQWAAKEDPRITKVGRLIRATRIDELPQLVAVLKGDLSLIGPRPERPEIEAQLEREIPNYRIRHWVRPGLSGWAQVCYPYGASIRDSRMKLSYDLYYLRNASILLDVLITAKTVRLVIGAKGATPKG